MSDYDKQMLAVAVTAIGLMVFVAGMLALSGCGGLTYEEQMAAKQVACEKMGRPVFTYRGYVECGPIYLSGGR